MGEKTVWKHDWCSLNILELNTLRTVEMVVDFRRTPPLTIIFLGTTISQDLKWDTHIDPAEAALPSPTEDVQPATGAAETILLCHHWIRPLHFNNCLVQLPNLISEDYVGLLSESLVQPSPVPTLRDCTYPEWAKGLAKSLCLDPSHPAHSLFELLPSG